MPTTREATVLSPALTAGALTPPALTEDRLRECPRPVAVVGPGTSRHAFGGLIDGYPTVIRLAATDAAGGGPESMAGTRTDYRADGPTLFGLLADLDVPADLFCFRGPDGRLDGALQAVLERDAIVLFDDVYDYQAVYDFCHAHHAGYDNNVGLTVARRLQLRPRGQSILEFGAGNGDLTRHFEEAGNRVTAVEISQVAFDKIRATRKIHGGVLDLPLIDEAFDLFVAVEVLEHLSTNDVKLVVRQAARLCQSLLVTVSTRPSSLNGPDGENLHLTVRPPEWWASVFAGHFDVQVYPGFFDRQFVIAGTRVAAAQSHRPLAVAR